MKSRLVFLSAILMLTVSGCWPFECITKEYSFEQTMSFSPERKSFHIGDTLWLKSSFYCTGLTDVSTGIQMDICDIKSMGSTLFMVKLVSGHDPFDPVGAVDKFEYLEKRGTIYTAEDIRPDVVKQLEYSQTGELIELEIGLIPKETGSYGLIITDGGMNYKGQRANECDGYAPIRITLTNMETNLELYIAYLDDVPLNDYERARGFFIEVVE